jgi:hypothetical protein
MDPTGARRYFGGPSLARADLTVFLEIPSTRAISEIDNPSDRCNRRISAQSSTLNTRFLPDSNRVRVSGKLVKIRLPRGDQYSVAVDILQRFGALFGSQRRKCHVEILS